MDYGELAAQYAIRYGIDPEIFVRQMMQESGLNPDAVSPKGALGIAQIMPDTARDPGYGVAPVADPTDPEEALRFGAEYMRAMLDRYDGDYRKALAAYNAGPGAVDEAGGVPPYRETQNYVATILGGKAMPTVPGGLSMGAPGQPLPSEDLMMGIQEDTDKQAVLESLMSRFRNPEQADQAMALAQMAELAGSARPRSEEMGLFSLPEARPVATALERMAGRQ